MEFDIKIMSDNDGFVSLQCPLCKEYFKLTIADIEADETTEIWCPTCGLKSDSYVTEEIQEMAMKKIQNEINNMLYGKMKQIERETKGQMISFKAGKKPKEEYVNNITETQQDFEKVNYKCCNKEAKIKTKNLISGGYCPFCGGIVDGN